MHPDSVRHDCPRKAGYLDRDGALHFEDESSANTKSAYPIRVSVANDREPSDSFHVGVMELDPTHQFRAMTKRGEFREARILRVVSPSNIFETTARH